jgi:N-acetylglutamate synthase-like GNAT family acetyltransferase
MHDIKIRKFIPDDLPVVNAILEKWNMAPRAATADVPNPERESLIPEHTFVALDEGKIVGVCSYLILSKDEAETASLAVSPECKGKGVGYKLQLARLKEMKERGFKRVHTETDRPETIQWYIDKFGYKKVGTNPKKHTFSLPDVDFWTVLKLNLTEYDPKE